MARVWEKLQDLEARQYKCGYCGVVVASEKGWVQIGSDFRGIRRNTGFIYICPQCKCPCFFNVCGYPELQIPSVAFGNPVENTPNEIKRLYEEARKCTSAGCSHSSGNGLSQIANAYCGGKGCKRGR